MSVLPRRSVSVHIERLVLDGRHGQHDRELLADAVAHRLAYLLGHESGPGQEGTSRAVPVADQIAGAIHARMRAWPSTAIPPSR